MPYTLRHTTVQTIQVIESKMPALLKGCATLEGAAQTMTNFLFEEYEDSILLIRFFTTMPFGTLPKTIQKTALRYPREEAVISLIHEETPVLTLVGLRGGVEMRNVKYNFAIPLVSKEFLHSIPMISQLLEALGFELPHEILAPKNTDRRPRDGAPAPPGDLSGIFYLTDVQQSARRETYQIVSEAERIAIYTPDILSNIDTIFAIGGAYCQGPVIAVVIFSKESLEQATARVFIPLIKSFTFSTQHLIEQEKLFSV